MFVSLWGKVKAKVSPLAASLGGILFGNMFLMLVLVAAVVYVFLWVVDATWLLWPLFALYCANVVVGNLLFRVHERGRGWWPAFCKVRPLGKPRYDPTRHA